MSSLTRTSPSRPLASWPGVVSLGLGVFAIVMSEFLPASLLPRIADDLDVSDGAAGQSVTATAFAAILAALFIAAVLPRTDRRQVMVGLTGLAVASDLLVAAAPNLAVLLGARILLGVALGGFWSMATTMAANLVPPDRLGRALTVINSGVALATVVAVPVGTWLGELWGWRGVFVLAAGLASVALMVQVAVLPSVAPSTAGGMRALAAATRPGVVRVGLIAVLLMFAGHFTGFTYIRPAAEHLGGIGADDFAALLLVFGLCNFVGTAISGPLADRALPLAGFGFPAVLGIGMLILLGLGGSTIGLFVGAAVWGFGFGGVPTSVLTWGARTAPDRLEQIGGLIVTAVNIAIALGAVTGGLLVDGVSASAPLAVGGPAVIGGALVFAGLTRVQAVGSRAS
jgi:predicted MFS family arabinose efflux permease